MYSKHSLLLLTFRIFGKSSIHADFRDYPNEQREPCKPAPYQEPQNVTGKKRKTVVLNARLRLYYQPT